MQPQYSNPQNSSTSFAGLLSALTKAKVQFAEQASKSSDISSSSSLFPTDNLQDDVATLTYDRALHSHAKYRSDEQVCSSARSRAVTTASNSSSQPGSGLEAVARQERSESFCAPDVRPECSKNKSASITFRMSQAEFTQLQHRASEANLSVSAYLRSCTFEAETLRAQVKQALAELRNQHAPAPPSGAANPGWLRLLHRRKS